MLTRPGPPPESKTTSYDAIARELDDAIDWFEDALGQSVQGTRLGEIQSAVRRMLSLMKDPPTRRRLFEHVDPVTAHYAWVDALAFGKIHLRLGSLPDHMLPRRLLRRAIAGPLSPADEERESSDARNVFSQLELAAHLAEKGLQPLAFEDVEFQLDDTRFLVEVKRLWSYSGSAIRRNIEEAEAQLRREMKLRDEGRARGIIALVVDRVAGLNTGLPNELRVWRPEDVQGISRQVARPFVEQYHPVMARLDQRIVGVLLVVRFLVHTLPDIAFGPAYIPSMIHLPSPGTQDYKRLELMADMMRGPSES